MAKWQQGWWCSVCIFLFLETVTACGTSTHIEISHRAQDNFLDTHSSLNYAKLMSKHPGALEAGSPYPDAFYDNLCFGGKYHDISEDTHWTPFMNASINYIRKHYPQPWDLATEKLVVFLLGVVSHQTADVSWHGLGIDQGFLDAMGGVNFHGSFNKAHDAGDIGGDVVAMYQLNFNYMPYFSNWYIPTDDLYNIYQELYGAIRIPRYVISTCAMELYAERLGEKLAIDKLYPKYAGESPYLVDEFTDYFLGGVDDMAVWTQNVWQETILMLERGTDKCTLDKNPIYVNCNKTHRRSLPKRGGKPERNGFYRKRVYATVGREDIIMKKSLRGVTLEPAPHLVATSTKQETVEMKIDPIDVGPEVKRSGDHGATRNKKNPDAVYSVKNTYAKLGWSMVAGDLDGDGNEDVVIGAPGFRLNSSPQTGALFVLYGSNMGLNLTNGNLEDTADVILYGKEHVNGRLGSAVTILDINQDGVLDIAAGAPSTGSSQLTYTGSVEVFYGVGKRTFVNNMTVHCQIHYCNLGRSLAAGDINGDGFPDLLIGSPFAGSSGEQRGLVTALPSSRKFKGYDAQIKVSQLHWTATGSQNYSWFGHSIKTVASPWHSNETLILVSQPAWRKCALPNCSFSAKDIQEVGKLKAFRAPRGMPISPAFQKKGTDNFQSYGSSVAVGKPYLGGTPVLAVAATGQNMSVSMADVPLDFAQAGAVYLYNLSNPMQQPLAVFSGDRRYGRFGGHLTFSDINGDGIDDLIIGSPLRTDDITGLFHAGDQGAAYIYYGGKSFPRGKAATSKCPGLSVKPCPAAMASVDLMFGESKSQFGTNAAVVKSKAKVDVLVTALHSSRGARLSGAVAVYSFPRA